MPARSLRAAFARSRGVGPSEFLRTCRFELAHRRLLEAAPGRSWERFFDEWVRGAGYPRVKGHVWARPGNDPGAPFTIEVELQNDGTAATSFHFPLRLAFREGGQERHVTIDIGPGETRAALACGAKPEELRIVRLNGVLGDFDISVRQIWFQ